MFVPPEAHFDGVYFYAIALDPFARNDDVYTRIDLHQYRYGHPGYAWLSGLFALGEPARLPWSMFLVSLGVDGSGRMGSEPYRRPPGAFTVVGTPRVGQSGPRLLRDRAL